MVSLPRRQGSARKDAAVPQGLPGECMKIAGVRFRDNSRVYDFDATDVEVSVGDDVIVESDRGQGFARVVRLREGDRLLRLLATLRSVLVVHLARAAAALSAHEAWHLCCCRTRGDFARERLPGFSGIDSASFDAVSLYGSNQQIVLGSVLYPLGRPAEQVRRLRQGRRY